MAYEKSYWITMKCLCARQIEHEMKWPKTKQKEFELEEVFYLQCR